MYQYHYYLPTWVTENPSNIKTESQNLALAMTIPGKVVLYKIISKKVDIPSHFIT